MSLSGLGSSGNFSQKLATLSYMDLLIYGQFNQIMIILSLHSDMSNKEMLTEFDKSILLANYNPIDKSLYLSGQRISDEHIEIMSKFVQEHRIEEVNLNNNCILKILSFSFNSLSASGIEEFCKGNGRLDSLDVLKNTLGDEGILYVVFHKNLKFLHISSNRLSTKRVESIAETQNHPPKSLKTGWNYFDAVSVAVLAKMKLKKLNWSESAAISYIGNFYEMATNPFVLAPLVGTHSHNESLNTVRPKLVATANFYGAKVLCDKGHHKSLKIKSCSFFSKSILHLTIANKNQITNLKGDRCHDKIMKHEEMNQELLDSSTCHFRMFSSDNLRQIIGLSEKMPTLEFLLKELTSHQTWTLKMSLPQQQVCAQLVAASIQTDKVTRLYDGNFDVIMVETANLYSKINDKESYIISGDFSNLYNCNKAIGKETTNEIMAIIISFYKEAFGEASPELIYGSRSGGDEFRFIVVGMSEEQLESCIKKVQKQIERFIAELGLDQLVHSKYPNNPLACGVGAEVAYKQLPIIFPSSILDKELDQAINTNKLMSYKRKVAKVKLDEPREIANDPYRLARVTAVISKYKSTKPEDYKEFPFKDLIVNARGETIFKVRALQVRKLATELGMNMDQTNFFLNLLKNLYDKKDEKTGMWQSRDLINSISDLITQYKGTHLPCHLLKIESHNFSSLNEILSHYGNDVLFKEMANIVSKYLNHPDFLCFYRGGGIIFAILPGINESEINELLYSICMDFYTLIGNKSIKEYCEDNGIQYTIEGLRKLNVTENTKLKEIPSMRGLHPGSGFIMSKIDLKKVETFNEAFDVLDSSNEMNKKLGVALKTDTYLIYLNGNKISLDKSHIKDFREVSFFKSSGEKLLENNFSAEQTLS
ncbi:TPA: hypothetical protein ACTXXA_003154 [Legionella anisa]